MKSLQAKLVLKMLICLMAISAVPPFAAMADLLDDAILSFERLDTYKTTLRSNTGEVIRYFYKKPGYIRMEFEEPHKGAVLVYDPLRKAVLLRPFRFWKSFEMNLKPEDSLLRSERGHTIDKSDIGSLLKNARLLRDNGSAEPMGDGEVNGRQASVIEVRGKGTFTTPDGVNRYRLWLDKSLMLPIKAEAWTTTGELIEEVLMDDIEADPALSMDLFS